MKVFDEHGNEVSIIDAIRDTLKDKLSIRVLTDKEDDYGDEYHVIKVSISFDGEEICLDSDTMYPIKVY